MAYISEKILDILKEGAEDTSFIINAMLQSRPESYRRFRTSLLGRPKRPREEFDRLEVQKENQKFYSTLNHLKRTGFIKQRKNVDGKIWSITKAGLSKLNILKKTVTNSKKEIKYKKGVPGELIIVAFDIPERFRGCRRWLREVLKFLGFSMVQQSVWVGNCKIPEEFISDLEKRKILKCVDIFEVGNKGTLERLKF